MEPAGDRHSCLRLIDANANRAREAIRVLEDYARFVLDDACLSEQFKLLRHRLCEKLAEATDHPLSLYRDTPGDVGTVITTEGERRREDWGDVLTAAGNRLTEAIRVVEEYGKLLSEPLGGAMEKLRYESYTLSSRLIRRATVGPNFKTVRLYVLLTESLCRGDWYETAEAALRGGAGALQLREKELSDRAVLERAKRLRKLCDRYQAWLIINDRPDIAQAVRADGVHLGQDDFPVAAARRLLGPDFLIGLSTHTLEQAQAALDNPPDYLAVGPMFASVTKPQSELAGPHTLDAVRRLTSLPLAAIGGITADNAGLLQSADTLAVCGAIISQEDPSQKTKEILKRISRESL